MKKYTDISNSARNRFNNIKKRRDGIDGVVAHYDKRGNFSTDREYRRAKYDTHSRERSGRGGIYPIDYHK